MAVPVVCAFGAATGTASKQLTAECKRSGVVCWVVGGNECLKIHLGVKCERFRGDSS